MAPSPPSPATESSVRAATAARPPPPSCFTRREWRWTAAGDLFIADTGNARVREVAPAGIITTIAGNGTFGDSGDGGPATAAELTVPAGVAVDSEGDVFLTDAYDNGPANRYDFTVHEVFPDGIITTVAGGDTWGGGGDGGPASDATFYNPTAVTVDAAGNLFIADTTNNAIRRVGTLLQTVTPDPSTTTITASPLAPVLGQTVTFTATVTSDTPGGATPTGTLTFYEGIPELGTATELGTASLTTSDGVTTAIFSTSFLPVGGHSFYAVYGGARTSLPARPLSRFGTWSAATPEPTVIPAMAGRQLTALLNAPTGMALDARGDLFIADTGNDVIREVTPGPDGLLSDGIITTVAGDGTPGYSGDGGPATAAELHLWSNWGDGEFTTSLAVDARGDLFIPDPGNNVVREVTPGPDGLLSDGIITTVAGDGTQGYSGDGGPATLAELSQPDSVAVDAAGDLFIADAGNNVVREVTPAGVIATVAGDGSAGYGGDGGPATAASMDNPAGVAVDAAGDLFIADENNACVREVTPDGTIHTIATTTGTDGQTGPTGVAVDGSGDLFIADNYGEAVYEMAPGGSLTDIADGSAPFYLTAPSDVVLDGAGDLYIVDYGTNLISRIGGLPVTVEPVTSSNLQAALNGAPQGGSAGSVTLQTPSPGAVGSALQAVNGLSSPPSGTTDTVTLDLGGTTASPATPIDAPAGVQVDLTSSGGDATVQGATVSGGTVVIDSSVAPVDWTVNGGNVIVEGEAHRGRLHRRRRDGHPG